MTFDSTGQAIGPHTARLCIGSDDADTPVLEVPLTLNVIYDFSGFFGHVLSPPSFNDPNSGSTVPLKFSLGGNYGFDIFAAGFPASRQIDCATKLPTGPFQPTETPEGEGLLSNPRRGYHSMEDRRRAGPLRELVSA